MPSLDLVRQRFGQSTDGLGSDLSGRYSNHSATSTAGNQIDGLLGSISDSAAQQERMNNMLTIKKNELDFNVALNKFIGKAGDNAKQLVGQ